MTIDPQTNGELSLDDHVVSMSTLAGMPSGVRSVALRRGTVVTPAARDLLRARKIALAYRTAPVQPAKGKVELLLGVANTRYRTDELVRLLSRLPITVRQSATSTLYDLIAELTKELAENQKLAILFTDDVAAAVCLGNRNAGVRAATARDSREAAAAVRSVGANLLIVDPTGRNLYQVKDIAVRFVAGGPAVCPEIWRGRL